MEFGFTYQRNDGYIKLLDYGARWYDAYFEGAATANQVYHVWSYVIQGANGFVGQVVGIFGNGWHDGGFSLNRTQANWFLARAGMRVGALISRNLITPAQLGDALRYVLGANGPGG